MAKTPPIGIHLGTTNCCVSVWMNGKIQFIQNELGENITPSYISFKKDAILFGKKAKNNLTKSPTNTLYCIKRLIGRLYDYDEYDIYKDKNVFPFKINKDPKSNRPKIKINYKNQEKDFYAEEILAMLFSYLKQTASDFLGMKIKDAVISVPNYFNDRQRDCLKDAATISGINTIRLTYGSVLVGLACYYNKNIPVEKKCLIFGFGGGFLDISIISMESGLFEVNALNGNAHLGGEDFDKRLIEFCIDEFKKKNGFYINLYSKAL